MANLVQMYEVMKLLMEHYGDKAEYHEIESDTIFLPLELDVEISDDFRNKLESFGAYPSEEYGCWIL